MDGFGSTDSSVGEEEGSDGGEDSVGDSDRGVDGEIKHQVGARVVGGCERLYRGGRGGPGGEDFQILTKKCCSVFKVFVTREPTLTLRMRKATSEEN